MEVGHKTRGTGFPVPRLVNLAEDAKRISAEVDQASWDLTRQIPDDAVRLAILRNVNTRELVWLYTISAVAVITTVGFWIGFCVTTSSFRIELLKVVMPLITLVIGAGGGAGFVVARSRASHGDHSRSVSSE